MGTRRVVGNMSALRIHDCIAFNCVVNTIIVSACAVKLPVLSNTHNFMELPSTKSNKLHHIVTIVLTYSLLLKWTVGAPVKT